MENIKVDTFDFKSADKYTWGNQSNISNIRGEIFKESRTIKISYLLYLTGEAFGLIFKKNKDNELIIKTRCFNNKVSEYIVDSSNDDKSIKKYLYATAPTDNSMTYFENRVTSDDSNSYIGLNTSAIYAFAKYEPERYSGTGHKVFLGKIPYIDISDVEYLNGNILFKEKSSGLYMIIDSLKSNDALLVYATLRDRCKEIF